MLFLFPAMPWWVRINSACFPHSFCHLIHSDMVVITPVVLVCRTVWDEICQVCCSTELTLISLLLNSCSNEKARLFSLLSLCFRERTCVCNYADFLCEAVRVSLYLQACLVVDTHEVSVGSPGSVQDSVGCGRRGRAFSIWSFEVFSGQGALWLARAFHPRPFSSSSIFRGHC